MQVVCASAVVFVVFHAPILCLAEVHITTPRQNPKDVKEHDSLTLQCQSTNPHAYWTHDGHPVSNRTGRFIIVEQKTPAGGILSSLTIVRAEPEDAGTYTCSCPHSKPGASINVTVAGHEHHSRVTIDGPKEVVQAVGSQLQLTCKADVHLSVEWLLNGVRLAESTNTAITTKENENGHVKAILLIRGSLAAHDFGLYSCRNVGDSNDVATVIVKDVDPSPKNGFGKHAMVSSGLAITMIIGMMIVIAN